MKSILFRIIGQSLYLKLMHIGFNIAYHTGMLKGNFIYKYHYIFPKFLEKGDIVLDIGANLGYYTKLFANQLKSTGHVYAVEPVSAYRKVLEWATKAFDNVTILPYALGSEEKEVEMIIPGNFSQHMVGRTQVLDNREKEHHKQELVTMKRPLNLFGHLSKIDFIKIDIEGYEKYVLADMYDLLAKHLPIILIEVGKDFPEILSNLKPLDYVLYVLDNGILASTFDNQVRSIDRILVPKLKEHNFLKKAKSLHLL
ncbi:MAG: FkbM family methyltransferase [Chitinophagales bacterium]|jgi:FkbM family methyltransferase|nr:FkbM family methyltransferase [Chitinophagales bacterium]